MHGCKGRVQEKTRFNIPAIETLKEPKSGERTEDARVANESFEAAAVLEILIGEFFLHRKLQN